MAHQAHQELLKVLNDCAAACEHCANACLNEPDVAKMTECIRLDRDCADICAMTAAWIARDSHFTQRLTALCAAICDACGAECGKHQHHDHCRECAEACRRCAEACRSMTA